MKIKEDIDGVDTTGPIDLIIANLQKLKAKYPNHEISIEHNFYGYDGGFDIDFVGYREENEQEKNVRLLKEKEERIRKEKAKQLSIERKKARFEKLKKEIYG